MRLFHLIAHAVAAISLLAPTTSARSQARGPLNYLTLVDNAVIQTPSRRVHAYSSFDLTFDIHRHKEHIRLKLEPNHDIFAEEAHVSFLGADGQPIQLEKIDREKHKVYMGDSYVQDANGHWIHAGWARVSVLRDGKLPVFDGAFTIYGDNHHIQLKSNYMATKHMRDPALEADDDEYMVLWRDSDVGRLSHTELKKRASEPACAVERLSFHNDAVHPLMKERLARAEGSWGSLTLDSFLGKRQSIDGGGAGNGNSGGVNLRNSIGNTAGCPKQRQVALVGVATDCSYWADLGRNRTLVENNVVSIVNTASSLYIQSFNITLGLRNITIIDQDCGNSNNAATPWNVACSDSVSMESRLNTFSQWRGQQSDTNAYWSLFTKCNFGSEVGLAWLGQLCNHVGTQQQAGGTTQTVTGANVVARTVSEWQVFAHETGHTFGAVHDCTDQTCANTDLVNRQECCPLSGTVCNANSQFLMNPFASDQISTFSPCSIGNICSALGRNSVSSNCLTSNRDVITVTGSVCGNGIVEGDEDCDCGGDATCAGNPCCNPRTCKFTTGSVCDPSNEGCCTNQCQFAAAGASCRASTGPCDPAETCPGSTGSCPADRLSEDGTGCGNGLQCASGQCTSRNLQCKTIMGTFTQGNDTYACDSSRCILSCGSPEFGANVCMEMNQNFLDGTPCDGNGQCRNGICQGSNVGGQIRSWIQDNRTLVIALASVIGGLLLIGVLSCIWSCCRRRRGRHPKTAATPSPRYQQPPTNWQRPNMTQQYASPPGYQPATAPGYPPNHNYARQQSVRYA